VTIDPDMLGRVVPTDLGIVAEVKEAAADLHAAIASRVSKARLKARREARLAAIKEHTDKLQADRIRAAQTRWNNHPLSWERVAGELNQVLEQDAIIVPELAQNSWLGSGENTGIEQFDFGPGAKTRIGRTTGSALGWGVGAAIGVKLAQPDRQVVALQGDGGFMFAQAETLWTMARYEVPIIIVIFNNRSYNGPRNKIMNAGGRQSQAGRDMTCYLGDPDVDFAKVAAGFGVKGEMIDAPDQVKPAMQRALDSTRDGKPYLLDAVVGRTGAAAGSTWYPKYSVASLRARKV
jgi:thiamine pyrophosphate-dependent acetolactate synthase large subunit-like protein